MTASRRTALLALLLSWAVCIPVAALGDEPPAPPERTAERDRSRDGTNAPSPREVEPRYIITFDDALTSAARGRSYSAAAEAVGVGLNEVRPLDARTRVVSASRPLSPQEAEELRHVLAARPGVTGVERDLVLSPSWTPNDPRYPEQWHYHHGDSGLRLPAAWDRARGDGVVVAVVDTGMTEHPDLRVVSGYDFVSENLARDGDGWDPNPRDEGDWCDDPSSWHGTHVAGTVGAVTDNGTGVAGVAGGAVVQPVRVLGACGGYLSDIAAGLRWAAGDKVSGVPLNKTPADVINLSLGGESDSCPGVMQSAIDTAVSNGSTVVVAAGNDGVDAATFTPGNCDHVVTVAAGNRDGSLAGYSNYGSAIDLTAPGSGVLSTTNTGGTVPGHPTYGWMSGTSMAAPHVSGLAALALSANSSLTPAAIEASLTQGARPMPVPCPKGCGAGLADASSVLESVTAPAVGYDGDGVPDVVVRTGGGDLRLYSGDGAGGLVVPSRRIGTGWGKFSAVVSAGDADGDGRNDLVAVDPDGGALWLYPGDGSGRQLSPRLVGDRGWQHYLDVHGVGDLNGDGSADLVGRDGAGRLWFHNGRGDGYFEPRVKIGYRGWDTFVELAAVGDVDGDGRPDLAARTRDGSLYIYYGRVDGRFGDRARVGTGWHMFTHVFSAGDLNLDGRSDVLGRTPDGLVYFYAGPGKRGQGYAPRQRIDGTGWNFNQFIGIR